MAVSVKASKELEKQSVRSYNAPKPAKNFQTPTNPPQDPIIPAGYVSEPTSNGNGIIWRQPGTTGDANTIQIYKPTKQYENGYWKQYNSAEPTPQAINPSTGNPGTKGETHIPRLPKK